MSLSAYLIYPNQLFEKLPFRNSQGPFFLVEDPLFFGDESYPASFHRMKLFLHQASMSRYGAKIGAKEIVPKEKAHPKKLLRRLKKEGYQDIYVIDPVDDLLRKRLKKEAHQNALCLHIVENPNFLTTKEEADSFFEGNKGYFQTQFYIWQRKRLNLLIEKGKPLGGKWTYDSENRKKLPLSLNPGKPLGFQPKIKELEQFSETFPKNIGSIDGFNYPLDTNEAKSLLEDFIENRLINFGAYQDAMTTRSHAIYHSLLSSSLNIGLLTPNEIVQAVLAHKKAPLASKEGFIRQIIGWREFMRQVYEREAVFQRTSNFFGFSRKLSNKWYEGVIGIDPVDKAIKKALKTGYNHHIERLMILSNFMLLTEIHPDEAYRWFMELFIDSYDWVMVPNVYGMGLYADGGLMVTKPYISGSNYILKMSDTKKGPWCEIWDALYWRFIHRHQEKFLNNPRMSLPINLLNKMDKEKLKSHLSTADEFLRKL